MAIKPSKMGVDCNPARITPVLDKHDGSA